MRFARKLLGKWGVQALALGLVLASGCASPPRQDEAAEKPRSPIVLRLPLGDSAALRKVTDCIKKIAGMNVEQVRQEMAVWEADLRAGPNVLTQVCLALGAIPVAQEPNEYERALSLLGDSIVQLQSEPKLVAWLNYVQTLTTERAASLERERRLLAERSDILRRNEAQARELEGQAKELSESKATAARLEEQLSELEGQLNELKSIESSILQRDIEGGAAKP